MFSYLRKKHYEELKPQLLAQFPSKQQGDSM
jgi:hypothetical protein